jgi:hypothetical protein
VVDVGELRRGVVAPDRDPADVRNRGIRRRGELGARAVVVEPGEGAEALAGDVGGGCRGDERVRVRGVAHDDDADVVGGDVVERGALRAEDARVRREEIGTLHARRPRRAPTSIAMLAPSNPTRGSSVISTSRSSGNAQSWSSSAAPSAAFSPCGISSSRRRTGRSSPSIAPEAMRKSSA